MISLNIRKLAMAIALATASTAAIGAGVALESDWYGDSGLKAQTQGRQIVDVRKLQTRVRVTVANAAEQASTGEHRLVIKTRRTVTNADGITADGYPYVTVCDSQCVIDPAAKREISIHYRLSLLDLFFPARPDVQAQNVPFRLQLLHAADIDGQGDALGNVKAFSALVETLRNEFPDNTITASSGDNYIPGPRFSAAADASLAPWLGVPGPGRADIAFLNAMKFQVSAVGNHDLDTGPAGFAGIISEQVNASGFYPGAQFPYLSANLDFSTDAALAPLIAVDGQAPDAMKNRLARYSIIEVSGHKIGVVGATTPTLDKITSTGGISIFPVDETDIAALAADIQLAVDELQAQGLNKIILLAHMQQIAVEKQLATLLKGVDIIVAGGSNTLLADSTDMLLDGDVAADTYPLALTSASGEPVALVNTDGDYKYLGRLVSDFDLHGRLITQRWNSEINGAYASHDAVLEQLGNPLPNAEVVAISDALANVLAERDGNIIGKSAVYLEGRRNQVRSQETNLGNLTADANLWLAQQVNGDTLISIKNGGGIRDDIGYFAFPPGSTSADDLVFYPPEANPAAGKLAGDISQFDIQGALSFNNELSLLTVTAEQLRAIVEHGVAAATAGATPGQFPQVAGIRFSFDPALPAGSRVRNLAVVDAGQTLVDAVVQDGMLLGNAERTFRLVTLNFLAAGGDGYPFPQNAAANRLDLVGAGLAEGMVTFAAPGTEQDALAEYLNERFRNTPYSLAETPAQQDQRIQNLQLRTDGVF